MIIGKMIKKAVEFNVKTLSSLFSKLSFKRKLTLFSLLLSIAPVLIVGLSSSYLTARSMQNEVNANHTAALNQIQFQMNNLIKSLHITSIRLATNLSLEKSVQLGPTIDHLNETLEVSEVIRRESSLSTIKFHVTLAYLKYNYTYTNTTDSNKLTDEQIKDIVAQGKPLYNSSFMVIPDPNRNREDLLLFRPVPLSTNYTDGLIILHVSVHELIKFLSSLSEGMASKILIVDENGKIVVSKDTNDIGTRLNLYSLGGQDGTARKLPSHYELDGIDYTVSAQTSQFADWTYIIVTPTKVLTSRSDSIRVITWATAAIILVIWILVALLGSYRLYNPIARILQKSISPQEGPHLITDGLKALDTWIENMVRANSQLKKELHEQSPYLQQSIIQQLLLGEMSESQMAQHVTRFQLPMKGNHFCVAVVAVDQFVNFSHKYKEKDRTLIHYSMRKIIEEILGEAFPCLTTATQPGLLAVMINAEATLDAASANRLNHLMDDIRKYISQYFQFTVSIAVSPFRTGYTNIHDCHQDALALLRHRLLLGPNVTISHSRIDEQDIEMTHNFSEIQKTIVYQVMNGNLEEAESDLSSLILELPKYIHSAEAVIGSFAYLLGELENMLHRYGSNLQEALGVDPYKELHAQPTILEVQNWLSGTVFPAVQLRINDLSISRQTKLINQVLHYLEEHYQTDLTLQQLAEEFRVSPSHLRRLFKEETNKSFSEYLMEHRMQKAKEWLCHSNKPIKEIADQLRYTNVTNFTRAYKQFFGTSPGKFREQSLSD
jgi:AraC-like DNA-binding protein